MGGGGQYFLWRVPSILWQMSIPDDILSMHIHPIHRFHICRYWIVFISEMQIYPNGGGGGCNNLFSLFFY